MLYGQFRRAENEKRVAFSRDLVLSGRRNLREDPQRALLLLQEAQRLVPAANLCEQPNEWSLEPEGHQGGFGAAAFSSDGSRVLTASDDGTARLWPSWCWDPEAFAKLDVGCTLTCEECRTFLDEDLICTGEPVLTASGTAPADAVTAH